MSGHGFRRTAFALATAALLHGQGVITTIAGTDWVFPTLSMPALQAPLGLPQGMALDRSGNLLVLDGFNQMLFRYTPDGILTVAAGNGLAGFSGDGGNATRASMQYPDSVAVDRAGNIYVGDGESRGIRKIAPDQTITTISGLGSQYAAEGLRASEVAFASITSMAVTPAGELIVGDDQLDRIFKIGVDGVISVVAGSGRCQSTGDQGPARQADVCSPNSIVSDASGNIYFIDITNLFNNTRRIRRIAPNGVIEAYAGNGIGGRVTPGPALQSHMQPIAIAVDSRGGLVITSSLLSEDSGSASTDVVRITPGGILEVIEAPGMSVFLLNTLCVDAVGNIYASTGLPGRVFKITTAGTVEKLAGNEQHRYGGDGGPATLALLSAPAGLALDPGNNLYIADTGNGRIRKIDPAGVISTVAGNGQLQLDAPPPGVPATESALLQPLGITIGSDGLTYFSSSFGLHRINQDGTQAVAYYPAAGPGSIAFDAENKLYYADRGRNILLRLKNGTDTLFEFDALAAGNLQPNSSGDGGPAKDASISSPTGVAIDPAGNVYVSEAGGHRVRRIATDGIITTFAGNGRSSQTRIPLGLRPAGAVSLTQPTGLAFDRQGNLLVRSQGHLSRVTASGQLEVIAGIGPSRVIFGDGGLATQAALGNYGTMAVDEQGNIYLTEIDDGRVRKILAYPPAFQVSATALRFSAASGGAPTQPQTLSATGEVPGLAFNLRVGTTGGNWLRVSAANGATPRLIDVNANPAGLAPGTYTGTIEIEAPLGQPNIVSIDVTFQVGAALPANLQVDKTALTFTYPRTAARRSQSLVLSNSGSGNIAASVVVPSGGFLRISPAVGTVTPATPLLLSVEADPGTRRPGTYRSSLTVSGAGTTREIAVTMTISDREQAILLSQSGLSFQAVAEGGVVPPQSFAVLNQGNGAMPWRITTSTLAGGSNWLKVSATTGIADAASKTASTVDVRIDQAGLAPGVYYGLVQVDSAEAANSPHVLPVFLEVLPANARPASVVQPAELTFTTAEGQGSPGSQDLTVFNLTRDPIAYRSVSPPLAPNQPLQYAPIDANVLPQEPQRIVVQPLTHLLRAGTYRSDLTLQFADGTVRRVDVRVLVTPAGGSASSKGARSADACSATQLVPVLRSLGQAASVPAGWPAGVAVEVQDDCGRPLEEGTVTMSFSNGDPPVALQSLKDGRWHGTWAPRAGQTGSVNIRVIAEDRALQVRGEREVSADLRAGQDPPSLGIEGVVSTTTPVVNSPVAPGALITLNGERFTVNQTLNAPANAALPTRLGDTEVLIGARRIPLFAASAQRIDAVVPADLPTNTLHQVLVRRGLTYSRTVPVNVADAQPAILLNAQAGGTQALAQVLRDGEAPFNNTTTAPARVGDRITVSCTGLGAVTPPVEAGQVAPAGQVRTQNPVIARVGGREATVSFAGLVPGQIGRYQVTFTIPAGTAAGDRIPVELESQGQVSPAATLVVR